MAPVRRRNPTLSEDLISHILVRVPVKSLLRFYSVSKTWLSLIKSPAFVKSQLRHALATQTDQTLLSPGRSSLLHVDSREYAARLKFPYPHREYEYVSYVKLVGSTNGIVCFAVGLYFENSRNSQKTDIFLWNPAIRQSKLIPSLFNASDNIRVEALGFGYDEVDHDFKVPTCIGMNSPTFRCDVYSDNRNAWRNVPQPIDHPGMGGFHVCINGFLCGIGNYGMMAFDLNQEVLNCGIKLPVIDDAHAQHLLNCAIKLPVICDVHEDDDDDDDDDYSDPRIIEFNNSVAFIMLMGSNKKINMWTLDDDVCLRGTGVEASWTPMLTIDLGMPADMFHGYFSNGNLRLVLLMDDIKMWFSCNADKKEAKISPPLVDITDHHADNVIYKYKETLVSLAGFRNVN